MMDEAGRQVLGVFSQRDQSIGHSGDSSTASIAAPGMEQESITTQFTEERAPSLKLITMHNRIEMVIYYCLVHEARCRRSPPPQIKEKKRKR
mmetsp:Transcript_15181/g.30851  ORF Transcript_15181/g.30851 Transcript_15181/m.30851 type:complete len:92 (+) Transcript_15181:3898-4173(+)